MWWTELNWFHTTTIILRFCTCLYQEFPLFHVVGMIGHCWAVSVGRTHYDYHKVTTFVYNRFNDVNTVLEHKSTNDANTVLGPPRQVCRWCCHGLGGTYQPDAISSPRKSFGIRALVVLDEMVPDEHDMFTLDRTRPILTFDESGCLLRQAGCKREDERCAINEEFTACALLLNAALCIIVDILDANHWSMY